MGELSSPWDEAMDEIATLRDQVTRRDEEISDLRHEIESARDAARGENALRLEAERERDTLRAAARDAVAAAYSEAFQDAWNLTRGLDADDDLIREQWIKSMAVGKFPALQEGRDDG